MKILAIGAHPADVFDNAGGTLLKHINNEDEVSIYTITHGAFSHAGVLIKEKPEEIIKQKESEFFEACKEMGLENSNIYFKHHDDEPLLFDILKVEELALTIQLFRPEMILTHHPNEYVHTDHGTSGEIVLKAIKYAGRRVIVKDAEPIEVRSIYMYGHQGRSIQSRMGYIRLHPDVIINIEDVIDTKNKVLGKFVSQRYTKSYLEHRLMAVEGGFGFMHGYKYAETFISLYPMKCELLPHMQDVSVYSLIGDLYSEDNL